MSDERERVASEADLREMFQWFADVRERESPLYARLCRLVAKDAGVLAPLGPLPARRHLPVLALTAIHYLALGGDPHPLAATFRDPATGIADDAELTALLASFVGEHGPELAQLMATRRTQTNEVGRSAAIAPAMTVAARLARAPLALVEVGASAGLNLHYDRYAVHYSNGALAGPADSPVRLHCELRGPLAPPAGPSPAPVSRAGLDISPLDVTDEAQTRWLRACLFPDQPERAARLRAAIGVARQRPAALRAGDVLAALPALVREAPAGAVPVVMHTWVLAYLPQQARDGLTSLLGELSRERPLLWLGAEWPDALPGREPDPADEATVWALAELRDGRPHWHTLASSHDHATWLTWRYQEAGS